MQNFYATYEHTRTWGNNKSPGIHTDALRNRIIPVLTILCFKNGTYYTRSVYLNNKIHKSFVKILYEVKLLRYVSKLSELEVAAHHLNFTLIA